MSRYDEARRQIRAELAQSPHSETVATHQLIETRARSMGINAHDARALAWVASECALYCFERGTREVRNGAN